MTDNETAVIASVIREPKSFQNLRDILEPIHFHHIPFQWAWKAFEELDNNGLILDGISLADELDRMGKLQDFTLPGNKVFGRVAVSKIRDIDAKGKNGETYAEIVLDYYNKRQLQIFASEMATQAMNGRYSADIIRDFETKTSKLNLINKIKDHTYTMEQAVENASEATERASSGVRDLLIGLPALDDILYIQKTNLITIAAQTSHGKTGLLCQAVYNSAKQGKRWTVFTIEGGHVQFTQRLIGLDSQIETRRIMRGQLSKEEREVYDISKENIKALPIRVIDLSPLKISQMGLMARKYECDAIGLDYLQLVSPDKATNNRTQDVGEISRAMLGLAVELNIPVIQLAQLSRAMESRSDKRPRLSDLRESGSIEQDSTAVVFIYRPNEIDRDNIQFLVDKNRNGEAGRIVEGKFIGKTMSFVEAQTTSFYPNIN